MATLNDEQRKQLWARWMEDMSNIREPVPVLKSVLRDAITVFDQALHDAELQILANVTPEVASWLTSHKAIARQIMIEVQKKRRECL